MSEKSKIKYVHYKANEHLLFGKARNNIILMNSNKPGVI